MEKGAVTTNYPLAYLRQWKVARIKAKVRRLHVQIASNLSATSSSTVHVPTAMERLANTAKIWKLCERDIAASIRMQNREAT